MLESIAPQARLGSPSAIPIRELEECAEVSAIALCWHLAALADPIRGAKLTKNLIDKTGGLVVGIEAAAIAMKEGISVDQALEGMAKGLGLSKPVKRTSRTQNSIEPGIDDAGEPQRGDITGADTNERIDTDKDEPQPRRLPPLVMPPYTSKRCCELVTRLLSALDSETKPGHASAASDDAIEERALACHLAMCWFIGAVNDDPSAPHPMEQYWLKRIPMLVSTTRAVGVAEEKGITVLEALKGMGTEAPGYEIQIDGRPCFHWVDADGNTQMSGPNEVRDGMSQYIQATDFLRTVSHAIGENVNALEPDTLDDLLGERHSELAQLVADGSQFDVSQEQYDAFVDEYGSFTDKEFGQVATSLVDTPGHQQNRMVKGMRRSLLIRVHMMKAKIEERLRRKSRVH
ncbi:MAG: hypothetical protein WBD95_19290 [Xanthobacteraceae bacterium]